LASAAATVMVNVAIAVLVVVETVRVEVPALLPLIVIEDGLNEQVGAGVPPVMLLQEGVTVPVYPLAGVMVMVDVADPPTVTLLGLSALALRE
jgi:hypothetical protein